jgi:hypothetical protein
LSLYVWYSPAASTLLQTLSSRDRTEYDRIEDHIRDFPRPIAGNDFVVRTTWFGREFFRYFDDVFPYAIWYDLDDDGITIVMILPAATKRTSM